MLPTDKTANTTKPHIDDRILSPASIAVIGASANPAKIGSQIVTNILNGGYQGGIFPINPKGGRIQGLQAYPKVTDVPEAIDHAVIAVPADIVPAVLEECGRKQIPGATVISAGFREVGAEGMKREQELISISNRFNISLIGPNCLGFMNTDIKLNATFSASDAKKGNIILFSQSGAFGTAILDWAKEVNLGFKHFVSLGNKAVVDETTLLEYWFDRLGENNENIIFAGYLEDIRAGRKFMNIASKLSKKHPVVVLKPGKTEHTIRAISSHTGAMATQDKIINTALAQSGCIRVDGIQRLFDTIQILSRQSVPKGNRVAIVTNAGGPGVAATDLIEESSLEIARLSEATVYSLQQTLPPAAGVSNPVDVLGDATADRYQKALEAVLVDENVDSVIVLLTPQAVTEVEKTAGIIAELYRKYAFKPIVATFIGGEIIQSGVDILNHSQMPIFTYPRQAISALSNAYLYRKSLDRLHFNHDIDPGRPTHSLPGTGPNIVGLGAETFVNSYGIRTPPSFYLNPGENPTKEQLQSIQFPVVAKIISPKFIHKTELSAVKMNIKSETDLLTVIHEFRNIWSGKFPNSNDYAIHVQQFIEGDHVILGFKRDPNFGPVLLLGSGGIFTELFDDSTQRVAPISQKEARSMVDETRISKILRGYRGKPPRDIDSIVDSIGILSIIAMEHPEITEFDINPFIVLNEGHGGYAVDVKIITNEPAPYGTEEKKN